MNGEKKLIKKFFHEYFKKNKKLIKYPDEIERREFGFTFYQKPGMYRHISFNSLKELTEFLEWNTPINSHYSSAFFKNPAEREMEKKGWIGAEIVFDIDADHLSIPKDAFSFTWKCNKCGESGFGRKEKCSSCGSYSTSLVFWPNTKNLREAKKEAEKVLFNFLMEDFGLNEKDLLVNFSGQRGYHIHLKKKSFYKLKQKERREILDYLKGVGWKYDLWFRKRGEVVYGPGVFDPGWKGIIARSYSELLSRKEKLTELEISKRKIEEMREKSSLIKNNLQEKPAIWSNESFKLTKKEIGKIVESLLRKNRCSIDETVALDLKKLIRIPNTLHGKTGFQVKTVQIEDLDMFNPLKEAVLETDESVKIKTGIIPEIDLKGEKIGPYKFEEVEVPLSTAVLFILKGEAKLSEPRN